MKRSCAIFVVLSAFAIGVPGVGVADGDPNGAEATYDKVKPILDRNCLMCHSEKPAMPFYGKSPAGVRLDSAQQLEKAAARVLAVATQTDQMPPGNLTAMTDEERKTLAAAIVTQWPQAH
jgi:uncharacterized membrane protein